MSTNARWIIGILLALVIGLGVALAIVAGDDGEQEPSSTSEPAVTETQAPTQTQAPTEAGSGNGGVAPPDGSGGLGE